MDSGVGVYGVQGSSFCRLGIVQAFGFYCKELGYSPEISLSAKLLSYTPYWVLIGSTTLNPKPLNSKPQVLGSKPKLLNPKRLNPKP